MVAHQVLVEVLGREVPIARAVLLQDPFDLVKRRAAPRGPPQAPVHKTRRPLGFVAVAKPAKMTLRHPQDLRRLQTAQRAAAIAAQCFCYAHNPYLRIHRYPRFLGTLQETGHIACYTFRTYLVLLTGVNPANLTKSCQGRTSTISRISRSYYFHFRPLNRTSSRTKCHIAGCPERI